MCLLHNSRLIDTYISFHFCSDKDRQKEFYELIIANERMTFSSKIQVFEYLLKKHKKNFVSKYFAIFSDLKNLNEERNIVAHYLLDTSPEGIERYIKDKSFGFVKFRNSTETIWRTNEYYLKFHLLHVKYIEAITEFLNTLLPSGNPVDKNNPSSEKK